MKRILVSLLALLSLSISLVSCGDDTPEPVKEPEYTIKVLNVSQKFVNEGMNFLSQEDTRTLLFTATGPWQATVVVEEGTSLVRAKQEWCTLDKEGGEAGTGNSITVHCLTNRTNKKRTAVLKITCGESTATVNITQMYEARLELTGYDINCSDQGGKFGIRLDYNVDHYKYTIPTEVQDWVSIEQSRAMQSDSLTFIIAPSPVKKRTTYIPFIAYDEDGNELSQQDVYITQYRDNFNLIGSQTQIEYPCTTTAQLKKLENGVYKNVGEKITWTQSISLQTMATYSEKGALISYGSNLAIPAFTLAGAEFSAITLNGLGMEQNEKVTDFRTESVQLNGGLTIDGQEYPVNEIYLVMSATSEEMKIEHLELSYGAYKEYFISLSLKGTRE